VFKSTYIGIYKLVLGQKPGKMRL